MAIHARAEAPPLRVMSFNIRYGTANDGENAWPHRKQAVAETIRRFDPDVLGLQEALAFQLDYLVDELPGYQLIGVGRDDGKRRGEFAALLVRRERLAVLDSGARWLSDQPDKPGSITWGGALPRVYTWADLRDKQHDGDSTGRLHVVNTHFDHQSQESREKSAAAIAEHLAEHAADAPRLFMGDLNAGPDNPAVQRLLAPDTTLHDTYAAANPKARREGTFNSFREQGDTQIDWLLASPHWRVKSAGVTTDKIDGRFVSDHFPVWAVLTR